MVVKGKRFRLVKTQLISSAGSMVMLVASGTAVVIEADEGV